MEEQIVSFEDIWHNSGEKSQMTKNWIGWSWDDEAFNEDIVETGY